MSDYDLGICGDESVLNQTVGALFNNSGSRQKLFSGTRTVSVLGQNVDTSWSVLSQPVFSLDSPPANVWAAAITQSGTPLSPAVNALTVRFDSVQVSMTSPGTPPRQTTTSILAICALSATGSGLALQPLGVVVDLSRASDIDRAVYQTFLIPAILESTATLFTAAPAPNIDIKVAQFGPPAISVGGGRLSAVSNLAGKGSPAPADPSSFPVSGNFCVLLSPEAMQAIASNGASRMNGLTKSTSGGQNVGLGSATYDAGIRIDNATANAAGPAGVDAVLSISAWASAGFTIVGGVVGDIVNGVQTAGEAAASAAQQAADAAAAAAQAAASAAASAASTVGGAVSSAGSTVIHAVSSY